MKIVTCIFFTILYLSPSVNASGRFKKVVWVVFENENYSDVLTQKDFQNISQNGALLTHFIAEVHPSQGNYIAMIAGSNLGVISDSPVNLNQSHIGDLIEKHGFDWKVYAENYPGHCFTQPKQGLYVRKHVPFLSFKNVTQNPVRCARITDESNFDRDFQNNNLTEFSMYIPNMRNDGHNTSVDYAGKWLTKRFGSILSHPEKMGDVLFIITFDESSSSSQQNQIYSVLLGSHVVPGSQFSQPIGHAALLKMFEDELNLGNLGRDDSKATEITGIWK